MLRKVHSVHVLYLVLWCFPIATNTVSLVTISVTSFSVIIQSITSAPKHWDIQWLPSSTYRNMLVSCALHQLHNRNQSLVCSSDVSRRRTTVHETGVFFSEESRVASGDRRSKVIEADRAGSCSTPLSSQLQQPQMTPPADTPGSTQLTCVVLSFSVCGHADLRSANEGSPQSFAFNWLNKGKSPLSCALHVYGDEFWS